MHAVIFKLFKDRYSLRRRCFFESCYSQLKTLICSCLPKIIMDASADSSSSNVSFSTVKEVSRKLLFSALDKWSGSKTLVWDVDLMNPFNLITGFKELQDHQVVQMLLLRLGSVVSDPSSRIVFLMHPKMRYAAVVADIVHSTLKQFDNPRFHLIFVPQRSVICEYELKRYDIIKKLSSIEQLPIYFYAWDDDLISMENEWFPHATASDDYNMISMISRGLIHLEEIYGPINNIYCKGNMAKDIYDAWSLQRQTDSRRTLTAFDSYIDSIIIFDRSIDYVTPMVTQLTYEGLIDEIFGIKCASVKMQKMESLEDIEEANKSHDSVGILSTSSGSQDRIQISLNSKQCLYSELRDLNFHAVGSTLSKSIKEQRHTANSVREYKEFVKKLPTLQASRSAAALHTSVAELIKEVIASDEFSNTLSCEREFLNCIDSNSLSTFIEQCINKKEPMLKVLRLMCLQSLTNAGLKTKLYDQYRREFLQSYGYQYLLLFVELEKVGLFTKNSTDNRNQASSYPNIRKLFDLIIDNHTNELFNHEILHIKEPNDVSYVYSGYAPLIPRLCHQWAKPGWTEIMDSLSKVPGITKLAAGDERRIKSKNRRNIVLVLFVGGVTSAEVSALRFLSSQETSSHFLVATTSVTTGERLLECLAKVSENIAIELPSESWFELLVRVGIYISAAFQLVCFVVLFYSHYRSPASSEYTTPSTGNCSATRTPHRKMQCRFFKKKNK
ncbi:Vacuolar protein sorting-associated protein 33A [Trichinella britovi]|uniref:Vacuolar protein sorting-associated protein 33A n=1 Tax=Trichinella britovi TaxID=45882 RepID=A0A0V1CYA9_TRIBR|nr:Vacuolar protein sorting-associated protein 33A [Trichinella britovi]